MIHQLWSTPVMRTSMPVDIRDSLVTRLLIDYDLSNPPSDLNNMNVLDNPAEEVVKFKNELVLPTFDKFLQDTVGKPLDYWKYRTRSWLTGSGHDYSINYHNHRGAQLSAVFYLWCEGEDAGGRISFTDPRQNSNRGYDETFEPWFNDLSFIPQSGEIAVFPSFLYHYVSTYHSTMRLAMPVDLFLYRDS